MDKYNCIDQFLEEQFIPKYLKLYKDSYFNHEHQMIEYIPLFSLERLNLNDEEFDYVMKYLDRQGIQVIGSSPAVYSDYPNYYYKNKCFTIPNSKALKKEEQKQYIQKYQMYHHIEDRNRIVESYLSLVRKIALSYGYITGIEYDDLLTAGFIGLIQAIDKVDVNKNFYHYFQTCVAREIVEEVKKIQGLCDRSKTIPYSEFLKSKSKIGEKYRYEDDYDEYQHVNEILEDLSLGDCGLNDSEVRRISLAYSTSLEDYIEDERVVSNTLEDDVINLVYQQQARETLETSLDKLGQYQQEIIRKSFFEGQTLDQIAGSYQVSDKAIDRCKKRACKNMKRQSDLYRFYYK